MLDGDVPYTAAYTRLSRRSPKSTASLTFFVELLDSVLDYPTYFKLLAAFTTTTGNLTALSDTVVAAQRAYKHGGIGSGSFVENHDQPRLQSITQDQAVSFHANYDIQRSSEAQIAHQERPDLALCPGRHTYSVLW